MNIFMLINLRLVTNANSFLLQVSEHENFYANKYENANLLAFSYLLAEKISCSAEMSMEKSFITLGLGLVNDHLQDGKQCRS